MKVWDSFGGWLDGFIYGLDEKRILNSSLFVGIGVGLVALIMFYYSPFYYSVTLGSFWRFVYGAFDPFFVAPYVMGFVTLFVFACYRSFWFKVLIDFLYAFGVLFSFVSVMGMRYWWEGLVFLPHAFFIVMQVVILVRREEQGLGRL